MPVNDFDIFLTIVSKRPADDALDPEILNTEPWAETLLTKSLYRAQKIAIDRERESQPASQQ